MLFLDAARKTEDMFADFRKHRGFTDCFQGQAERPVIPSKGVYCLARCHFRPRDEPLYDETRMTRLAIPTGCALGTTNGEGQSVERQRRYALSANQERVLSMIIPSSGFLDRPCLVLLPSG